ncbi:type III pantothenate kinase [Balneola sp. MJW-20]|uniref:type III pantothenate kinase n=1 Tax=Gracilimonas aurantiaca TaxID=3234185 RepID=UPI003466B70D
MSQFDSFRTGNFIFLDIGNTSVKGAHRAAGSWKPINTENVSNASQLVEWIREHEDAFDGIIVCSVRQDATQAILMALEDLPSLVLSTDQIPRANLDYNTIDTLGMDRYLACVAANTHSTRHKVVIDAGTACTIDLMTDDGIYRGGVIAPGYGAFSDILPEKAPALPRVKPNIPKTWPGKTTIDALKWGIPGFYEGGIISVLRKYENEIGHFDLFITGGDGPLIHKMTSEKGIYRPFLVFEGMATFIDYRD